MKYFIIFLFLFVTLFYVSLSEIDDFYIGILDNPSPGYIFTGFSADKLLPIYDNYARKDFTKEFDWLTLNFINLNYIIVNYSF